MEACAAAPGWTPLPRGSSHSMPTMAGQAGAQGAGKAGRQKEAPAGLAARRVRRETESDRNPLIKSLIWVLVGIGLVGLVLLGAQKFLFNPPVASTAEQQPAAPAVPDPTKTPAADKPSPVRPGEPESALPGDTDTAQPAADSAKPETAKPAPQEEVHETAGERAPPPKEREPAAPPKTEGERSVQLLTDPPGATDMTIDGNPNTSCKTPCLLSVSQGRHTLKTQLDGYRPYPRIFNVPGGVRSVLETH